MESEPQSYHCVRNSVNQDLWELSTEQDFEGPKGKGTFAPTNLTRGLKAVGAKWTHEWKASQHGRITEPKVPLVTLRDLHRKALAT